MNREIKFRAWQDNQMLIQPMSGNYGSGRFFGFLYEDTKVMQFTGLKDKNGKEIYEGDILPKEWSEYIPDNSDFDKGIVKFHEGVFYLDFKNSKTILANHINNAGYIEVIGNIYENPELIK
jgi:uncharacterized phage protein (TIGR01671 family)